MSEEEWLQCSETNPMFAAMEPPSEAQLAAFNLGCCRRIRHLITDDVSLRALDALESSPEHTTVPAELALAAQEVTSGWFSPSSPLYDPSRNWNAAKAIGHAVCRSLAPGSFHYWKDGIDNARLVALYCQWAVGRAADPSTDDEGCEEEADEAGVGIGWIRAQAEQAEASAQCGMIRGIFTRSVQHAPSSAAEPCAAPDPAA
jgi:hypothetical protein